MRNYFKNINKQIFLKRFCHTNKHILDVSKYQSIMIECEYINCYYNDYHKIIDSCVSNKLLEKQLSVCENCGSYLLSRE